MHYFDHRSDTSTFRIALFTLTLLLIGCSGAHDAIHSAPTTVTENVVQQVLTSMHLHAWNANAMTHGKTTGGLFINWKMDDPSVTNVTQAGTDGNAQHDHDPQVDLLYLASLSEYQHIHPQDHTYMDDFHRASQLVVADFKQYSLPKGWIYFYLLKIGFMNHDTHLVDEARTLASNFYRSWYDPQLGVVYDRIHTPGIYNTDLTLTCGAALIDAGLRWHQPTWLSAGKKTLDHTLAVALDPHYHLFYYSMTVSSDGHDTIANNKAKAATQGQAIDALLTAYTLTHKQQYLDVANQVLESLCGTSGLWDSIQGGFFFALDTNTGQPITAYKETRGQSLTLLALHHYDQLGTQSYIQQEQQLVHLLTNNFYESTYHGFFYRTTADFHIYVTHQGQGIGQEDYFTTEAMGGALDALLENEMMG